MRSIELDDYNCARSRRDGKQDWGELYRAAILESDESLLQQRIKDAWGAISDRSASLAKRSRLRLDAVDESDGEGTNSTRPAACFTTFQQNR